MRAEPSVYETISIQLDRVEPKRRFGKTDGRSMQQNLSPDHQHPASQWNSR